MSDNNIKDFVHSSFCEVWSPEERYIMSRATYYPDAQVYEKLASRLIAIEEKMDRILFLLDGNYLIDGKWVSQREILEKKL